MNNIKNIKKIKNDIDFSIIVATYNPNYNKLFQTLISILNQKNSRFEIIVTDDGSLEFDSDLIIDWMKNKKFNKYKIIHNEKNVGTVRNVYNALKCANGRYIKLISPGDYLYNDSVLYNSLLFIEKKKSSIIFGKAVYYNVEKNGSVNFLNKTNPLDIMPYIKNNFKKIKKSYLLYQDYILGASFICERKLLLKYIEKIVDIVKYAEDCSVILMVADDNKIDYWDNYLIWYECDTGISTCGNPEWQEKIRNDNKNCYQLIVDKHPKFKKVFELHYGKRTNMQNLFEFIRKLRYKFISLKKCFVRNNLIDIQKAELINILEYDVSSKGDKHASN